MGSPCPQWRRIRSASAGTVAAGTPIVVASPALQESSQPVGSRPPRGIQLSAQRLQTLRGTPAFVARFDQPPGRNGHGGQHRHLAQAWYGGQLRADVPGPGAVRVAWGRLAVVA